MSEPAASPCPACGKPIPPKHSHVCPDCWPKVPAKLRVEFYQMTARKQNTESKVAQIVRILKAKLYGTHHPTQPS